LDRDFCNQEELFEERCWYALTAPLTRRPPDPRTVHRRLAGRGAPITRFARRLVVAHRGHWVGPHSDDVSASATAFVANKPEAFAAAAIAARQWRNYSRLGLQYRVDSRLERVRVDVLRD
jgi:hypothetical protein